MRRAGEVEVVVNTPLGSGPRADGWEIRTAAVAADVPSVTTLSGLAATTQGLQARPARRRDDAARVTRAARAVPSPLPLRERASVLECRRAGAYRSLTLVAPKIARTIQPGQFVEVAVGCEGAFLLRRPFSVHQADRGSSGTIELAFEVLGAGTRT